ncbi:helix-turn-helix domain-containing protein [Shouchella sp. 1P09AA]|uniref:helix-turn-helix domain-containing protein n=1 Tax=Bacillaceae TaxID=186817 RepID=UPI0020D1AC3C|nr:helix-turn-helix domain-containing protein [Alkalihalobacillus sp. LMS6]UTR06724.1 helix-turn-helix domain-containing protein [Alkalihalobacillus sp. LMS6]
MLGQRLKELRLEKKLTQKDLAEGLVNRSYLSQIEKGTVNPSYDVLDELSKRLGCDINDFYKSSENRDLLLADIKKEIRLAERGALEDNLSKINKLVNSRDYLNEEFLTDFDKGILNWIHGKYFELKGDYTHSIPFFLKSLEYIEDKREYCSERVRSYDSLGNAYGKIGKNDIALTKLYEGYKLILTTNVNETTQISLLSNLGVLHGRLKEYYSAINFLEETQDLNKQLRLFYKAGDIAMALGICYMEIGRLEDAKNSYEQAIQFYKFEGASQSEAKVYTNYGILNMYQKNYYHAQLLLKSAIKLYDDSQEINIMNTHVELAKSYLHQNNRDLAIKHCKLVKTMKDENRFKAQATEILGDVYSEVNIKEAVKFYLEAGRYFKTSDHEHFKKIMFKIGNAYFEQNDYKVAADYYRKSN